MNGRNGGHAHQHVDLAFEHGHELIKHSEVTKMTLWHVIPNLVVSCRKIKLICNNTQQIQRVIYSH